MMTHFISFGSEILLIVHITLDFYRNILHDLQSITK